VSRKILTGLIGAALALSVSNGAMACATTAWDSVTGTAAQISAANPTAGVKRYSGLCGLRANAGVAGGAFVEDDSPTNETNYRARFYVRPSTTGGEVTVFSALNSDRSVGLARVTYDGTNFRVYSGANVSPAIPAPTGKWYTVSLAFASGGQLAYTVAGNRTGVADAAIASGNVTAVAGQVDWARLGAIAGGTGGTVEVDAFESRRQTDVPQLCRGDANNSNSITATDRSAVTAELGGTLQQGQPDCNEDGNVSASDRSCITARLGAFATCS
jgi:hypothetical protein